MHTVTATIRVELPADPKEMAGRLGEVASAWADFLEAVGAPHEAEMAVNETRAKPAGARRGRKPKLAAVPPGEAA